MLHNFMGYEVVLAFLRALSEFWSVRWILIQLRTKRLVLRRKLTKMFSFRRNHYVFREIHSSENQFGFARDSPGTQLNLSFNIRMTETRGLRLPDEPQQGQNRLCAFEEFSATLYAAPDIHFHVADEYGEAEYTRKTSASTDSPGTQLNLPFVMFQLSLTQNQIDLQMSIFIEISAIWVQVEHKFDGNSGTAPT
ncbi:hypothetical protein CSKR_112837 [Clonorchis sinensis]|uniref:Uncharacterized protein n=1 Tax=Clonorchis sinensis TaxID=79923 RepID=A0A419PGX1_CLOSI|nr:hypothetical protein CSKR_112837 [Clonorchis sinensis]